MDRFEHEIVTVTAASGLVQEMQVMVFHTKDYRSLKVTAHYTPEQARLLRKIKKLAFPKKPEKLFAFRFRVPVSHAEDGWRVFNLEREMKRQGALRNEAVDGKARGSRKGCVWRVSDINADYAFSPTYPRRLVVPGFTTDEQLPAIAKFRSKKRLPVLTYRHQATGAALLRSSQPLTGLSGQRGREDEDLLKMVGIRTIYDARPMENAFANKAKGGGYEDARNYSSRGHNEACELRFCDIHNIHRMRGSLQHVLQACENQLSKRSDDFRAELAKSKWLAHVRNLVAKSCCVAKDLRQGKSVLVHCSDGWDRTAQICALVQVMADPFFRTIRGLCVLIEKDWCYFGHKFHKRIGHASSKSGDGERSPIFMQFLDAVWQLWTQAPERFEFNERLLAFLASEVASCKYGTFLFDNDRVRHEYNVRHTTVSVWTHVLTTHKANFVNALYTPALDQPSDAEKTGTSQTKATVPSLGGNNSSSYRPRQASGDPGFLEIFPDCRLFWLWPFYYRQDLDVTRALHGAG
jgi:myotubularin-related protein 1/2